MFELSKLPYAYNALEPFVDELTMTIHHGKHHAAYVDNANKFIAGTGFEGKSALEVLQNLPKIPEASRTPVRNHVGGVYNHNLFWEMMGPGKGGAATGELAEAINRKFGGFDKFSEQFTAAAMGRFGSGWAWLVVNGKELEITSTANQDSPASEGKVPLMAIDVWEHSFYLRYQNRRADYVKAWWNVANWDYASKAFAKVLG